MAKWLAFTSLLRRRLLDILLSRERRRDRRSERDLYTAAFAAE